MMDAQKLKQPSFKFVGILTFYSHTLNLKSKSCVSNSRFVKIFIQIKQEYIFQNIKLRCLKGQNGKRNFQ